MAAWSALVACFVASRALELLELQIDGPPTVRVLYDDACARGAVVDELLDHFAMSAEARARTRAGMLATMAERCEAGGCAAGPHPCGYVFDDSWHVAAAVRDRAAGRA